MTPTDRHLIMLIRGFEKLMRDVVRLSDRIHKLCDEHDRENVKKKVKYLKRLGKLP